MAEFFSSCRADFRAIFHNPMLMAERACEDNRFYSESPVQGLIELLAAMNAGSEEVAAFRKHIGRRILWITGARGSGCGHFMSSLTPYDGNNYVSDLEVKSNSKLALLLARMQYVRPSVRSSVWTMGYLANVRLSHEPASCFEAISDVIYRWAKKEGAGARALDEDFAILSDDRLGRLRASLAFANGLADKSTRCLFVINGLGSFFDTSGRARNGYLRKAWTALIDPAYRGAPLDFLLLGDNEHLPREFRPITEPTQDDDEAINSGSATAKANGCHRPTPKPIIWIERANPDAKIYRDDIVNSLSVNTITAQQNANNPNPEFGGFAVHQLYRTRAGLIGIAYFPIAMLLLAGSVLVESEENVDIGDAWKQKKTLDVFANAKVRVHLQAEVKRALESVIERTTEGGGAWRRTIDELSETAPFYALKNIELLGVSDAPVLGNAGGEIEGLFGVSGHLKSLCERIFEACGRGRYSISLFFAMIMEVGRYESDKEDLRDSATRVGRFVERTLRKLEDREFKRRQQSVVTEALQLFERHDVSRRALPSQIDKKGKAVFGEYGTGENAPWFDSDPALANLINEILLHLSVIGTPVGADVLEWCPRIGAAIDGWKKASASRKKIFPIACLEYVLELCRIRCLVIPTAGEFGRPDCKMRYTVHRTVQSAVFQTLGTLPAEAPESDQHTVSLYATQPDNLPKLNPWANDVVTDILRALIGYPDTSENSDRHNQLTAISIVGGKKSYNGKDFDPATPSQETLDLLSKGFGLRARLLRAALSLMRSIYSIGILARYADHEDSIVLRHADPGLFEIYRRMVHWTLETAKRWDQDKKAAFGGNEAASKSIVEPFSDDEIAWMYNECALLSLAQGRMFDAHFHFQNAISSVQKFEPHPLDPTALRVRLNWAVCLIELGRLRQAREILEEIWNVTNETIFPPFIARGYLGLIQHLSGSLESAKQNYEVATRVLARFGRNRAAAIFQRHCSDLERSLSPNDFSRVGGLALKAERDALNGGHQDVRWAARLSSVRVRLDQEVASGGNFNGMRLLKELEQIEKYAKVTGLQRLLIEVELLRSRIHLSFDDPQSASTSANKAIELAGLYGMRVWRIHALGLASESRLAMGDEKGARELQMLEEEWARHTGVIVRKGLATI